MIRTERKYVEILRILKDHTEPMGAKRLSEIMAERGYVMTDRAVQYYLRYLDEMGFTEKVGNFGRVLTQAGIAETEHALVDERIGFIISKLERLAFRTTFDPDTGTGDVSYNLSIVPRDQIEGVTDAFEKVKENGCGFFNSYRVVERDPRLPPDHQGIMTVCSITMDGVFQRHGIPVKMAYGGRILMKDRKPTEFGDLIGYRGTTVDPLQLFISSELTGIGEYLSTGSGTLLANVREVPLRARERVEEITEKMRDCGFIYPLAMGNAIYNLRGDPFRLSIIALSGMNYIGHAVEKGFSMRTEIGAGNIALSKIISNQ